MTERYVSDKYNTDPLPAIAAGKTGEPETITGGGALAVGKIVFTGNLIAGDLVVINGVTFTCMASGAAGELQFDVGGSLSLSLDALITKLNACTNPLVSYATYTKTDTNTAVTSTSDTYDDANNSVVLSSTHSTVVVTAPTGGMDKSAISLETENTVIDNAAGSERYTLAAGDEFQNKTILNTGAGDALIEGTFTGGTLMTLNDNEYCALRFLNGEWKVKESTGAIT